MNDDVREEAGLPYESRFLGGTGLGCPPLQQTPLAAAALAAAAASAAALLPLPRWAALPLAAIGLAISRSTGGIVVGEDERAAEVFERRATA